MIVGFSKHGTGLGKGPIHYLTAESVSSAPIRYLTEGTARSGVARNPAPVVLRGDPEKTRALIDSLDFKHRYSSGVLSFAPGETIDPVTEQRILSEFERVAFAGLPVGRYDILWVRHLHAGHHECHFVTPRVELITGKSLNIAPPRKSTRLLFDTFRSKWNSELGLADPTDPARARILRLPAHIAKLRSKNGKSQGLQSNDVREAIIQLLHGKVAKGLINNRDDVVAQLKASGFRVVREGKDYLTVVDPDTEKRYRMRGQLFSRVHFDSAKPAVAVPESYGKPAPKRTRALEQTLERLIEARAVYNRRRYPEPPGEEVFRDVRSTPTQNSHDRTRTPSVGCTEAVGGRMPRTGQAVWHHARGLNEAVERWSRQDRNLECASRRFNAAHRAFADNFDEAVMRLDRRLSTGRLFRKYGIPCLQPRSPKEQDREQDLEREMEFGKW